MKRLADTEAFKLLQEQAELAHEIAEEVSDGEWVPPLTLSRYRSVKRKLEDFKVQVDESA